MKWLVAALLIWLAWRYLRPAPRVASGPEARARRVLGVPAGADAETIRSAHRRLVAEAHPDRGGSAEATREVNEARDTLLAAIARGR